MTSSKPQDNDSADHGTMNYDIDAICTTCSSAFTEIVEKYNVLRKVLSECDESEALVRERLKESSVSYHQSFHALRHAAKSGCHLCSLIEVYSTAFSIDPDLPVTLKVDIRNKAVRECTFDVSVDGNRTEVWLGLQVSGHSSPGLVGTYHHPAGEVPDAIFDMIRDWLRQCQAQHHQCRFNSKTFIPTRLVSVGTLHSSTVHLIETGNEFQAPYLTLSHCWGRNPNIYRRTSGGNLEIAFDTLPRTFKDAITATRRLGFEFLWIDSLCIIQGDKADWERESANMASIYSQGVLNLAATYSMDSHGGLLMRRNLHHITPCSWNQHIDPVSSTNPYGDWLQLTEVCWTFHPQSEFDKLGLGKPLPLISRGWVLQENMLSPRTVHFLPGEIIWECRELSTRESIYCRRSEESQRFRGRVPWSTNGVPVVRNGPKNFLRLDSDNSGSQKTTVGQSSGTTSNQKIQGQLYSQWYEMVTQFSQKDLTRSDDRLPAIWALAQRFHERTGDEYISGLWLGDILNGLLFKRFRPRPGCRTTQSTGVPSWSWSSTECEIRFEHPNPLRSSSSAEVDQTPDACLQRLVIDPTEPRSLSMGRTRQAELEFRTLAKSLVGKRRGMGQSPGQMVAKAMGISGRVHSDVWRRYEELSSEYDRSLKSNAFGMLDSWACNDKESWIREKASRNYYYYNSLRTATDCYFGWRGSRFVEEERWRQENNAQRAQGQDKILSCGVFELDFDTVELADRDKGRPVLCLHIKGGCGLLVELNPGSHMYRRIGVYRQEEEYESDDWELRTVTLI